jgi:predicted secreted protein
MKRILVFLCLSVFTVAVYATESEQLFNVFSLQAQAESDVSNDEMLVILAAEYQNPNPAALSQQINLDMQWALDQVKKNSALRARTLSYNSFPVYKDQKIIGWQATQQLELLSTEIAALNEMIGNLQKRLQVKQMSFQPTTATRKAAEDKLVAQALDAFKARAELVRKNMGAKAYRVVNIDINTGYQAFPVHYAAREKMASFAMDAVAPAVEAGTSKTTVVVSGSIQLQ